VAIALALMNRKIAPRGTSSSASDSAFGSGAYYCIVAFSETDLTEDLKKIDVPTLILHGHDDQVVPIDDSARLSAKIIKNATLKVYSGAPHGMCSTHEEQVNADLLAFIKGEKSAAA